MGIFKQMKDLKDLATAAPEMMGQAQRMAEQAQQMSAQAAAQQQAAMQQAPPPPAAPPTAATESIAGVDLALYATIVKAIAPLGYDQSLLPGIAAAHGIAPSSWQEAHDGWNARIQDDPAVARAFSDLYRA